MEAFTFWKGNSFSLLEYLSLLSTSANTSFSAITLYYDEDDCPDSPYWHQVDEIPRVSKQPAAGLLQTYLSRFLGARAHPIRDVRILADIFRYAHLFHQGGAWFDLDTLQVRDLAKLMAGREFTAGWESADHVNIAIMAFPPDHPVLEALLASLASALRGEQPAFNAVGPCLMTEILEQQGRLAEVLPIPYFYPIDYRLKAEVILGQYSLPAETHSIHVWAYLNRSHFLGKHLEDFAHVSSTFFDQVRALPFPVPLAAPTLAKLR